MAKGSRYSDTYKREAVAKAEASGNVSQTARELGISGKTLHTLDCTRFDGGFFVRKLR